MTPALLGLSAALLWGTADFLAKGVAEREGSQVALFWLYLVGFPIFAALAVWHNARLPGTDALALWSVAGVMNAGAYLLLYRGFRVGFLSVVSTTNAAWAAVTVALSALVLGHLPETVAWVGIGSTITGVILISYAGGGWSVRAPGFAEGLGAAVLFGTSFFLLKLPIAEGDVLTQATLMRGIGLVVVASTLAARGVSFRTFVRPPPLFGFLDSAGFLCFVTGLAGGMAYIVAPLGSLLTPVAVALAAVFLHERLHPWQWGGFALVVTGAALLA
jgi:drug/metabolite transporter (DMT)-like permease